jgi:hypothetical protein
MVGGKDFVSGAYRSRRKFDAAARLMRGAITFE